MIKIVRATPVRGRILRLEFSEGTSCDYDLAPLMARGTSLTSELADDEYGSRRLDLRKGARPTYRAPNRARYMPVGKRDHATNPAMTTTETTPTNHAAERSGWRLLR